MYSNYHEAVIQGGFSKIAIVTREAVRSLLVKNKTKPRQEQIDDLHENLSEVVI